MSEPNTLLLKSNLKQLRLPAMHAECEKLAPEAAAANESYEQYLLRLTELEVAARAANVLKARIKQAAFPVHKDFDSYDFSAMPSLNKPKILELARGEWIDQHANCCFLGSTGTGKTHLTIALGLAACRQNRKVRGSAARPRPWASTSKPMPTATRFWSSTTSTASMPTAALLALGKQADASRYRALHGTAVQRSQTGRFFAS
jgi:hypothetical protein